MPDYPSIALLLVEDDALVRLTLAMMLEEFGFTVAEAATGEEALRLIKGGQAPAVLVTDIDLGPGMSGLDLAEVVHALRPGLPVVFVTGRPTTLAGRPCRAGEAYLPKPFAGEALARTVRRLLPS